MDGERRMPVDVVKAGDDDIENSAARDLSLGVISGGRAAQKQQLQECHDKRGALSGQLVDIGQHLFARPSFSPNMLEGVGWGTEFVAACFLQAGTADRACDPPTVAPTFQNNRRAFVAPMDLLTFGTRMNRRTSNDHGRQLAEMLLVCHSQNRCRSSPHCVCERACLADGRPVINAVERRFINSDA